MKKLLWTAGVLAALVLMPGVASAQSAISGLVTDTSGAILPGVTVEASSDVLIEKVRSVVSDAQGRYSVVDLRPGVYKVTFTLPGFSSFVRDRIELPANFNATVNAELASGRWRRRSPCPAAPRWSTSRARRSRRSCRATCWTLYRPAARMRRKARSCLA